MTTETDYSDTQPQALPDNPYGLTLLTHAPDGAAVAEITRTPREPGYINIGPGYVTVYKPRTDQLAAIHSDLEKIHAVGNLKNIEGSAAVTQVIADGLAAAKLMVDLIAEDPLVRQALHDLADDPQVDKLKFVHQLIGLINQWYPAKSADGPVADAGDPVAVDVP
jgi:hypothetical protein